MNVFKRLVDFISLGILEGLWVCLIGNNVWIKVILLCFGYIWVCYNFVWNGCDLILEYWLVM